MTRKNIIQEFRLKNVDETRNYLIQEINRNELMSEKHKKVCTTLSYIEHVIILSSTTTACVSISAFAYLVGIEIGITSSAIGIKICAIAAGIKISQKLKKIKRLIAKALIDSVVSHDQFVLINNVLKECNKIEEIKNLKI